MAWSDDATCPTPDELEILERCRTPHERKLARLISEKSHTVPWLRTLYSDDETGQDVLENILDDHLETLTGVGDRHSMFLIDSERYSFGNDWKRVLGILPEIVHTNNGKSSPEDWQYRLQEVKEEIAPDLEFADDEDLKNELLEGAMFLFVRGFLWVQDAKSFETGKVRLIWLDEFGRVVRHTRSDDFDYGFLLSRDAGSDTHMWTSAKYGDGYNDDDWKPWPEEERDTA